MWHRIQKLFIIKKKKKKKLRWKLKFSFLSFYKFLLHPYKYTYISSLFNGSSTFSMRKADLRVFPPFFPWRYVGDKRAFVDLIYTPRAYSIRGINVQPIDKV